MNNYCTSFGLDGWHKLILTLSKHDLKTSKYDLKSSNTIWKRQNERVQLLFYYNTWILLYSGVIINKFTLSIVWKRIFTSFSVFCFKRVNYRRVVYFRLIGTRAMGFKLISKGLLTSFQSLIYGIENQNQNIKTRINTRINTSNFCL